MRGDWSRTSAPPRLDAAADAKPNLKRYYAAHRRVNSVEFDGALAVTETLCSLARAFSAIGGRIGIRSMSEECDGLETLPALV
jgi:hypothetical protein